MIYILSQICSIIVEVENFKNFSKNLTMFTKLSFKVNIFHDFDNSLKEFYNIKVLWKLKQKLLCPFVVILLLNSYNERLIIGDMINVFDKIDI